MSGAQQYQTISSNRYRSTSPRPHFHRVARTDAASSSSRTGLVPRIHALDPMQSSSAHSTGSYRVDESDEDMENLVANNDCLQRRRFTPHIQDKMRRKLKYFFMSPCEKWYARKKFPWKLFLQIVKILFVTVQLLIFGFTRKAHVNFLEKSQLTFKHLFLRGWDTSFETMPYPPAAGQYALYTIPDFYKAINYALMRYNRTEDIAIGTYSFSNPNDEQPDMVLCVHEYKVGKLWPFNQSYLFDPTIIEVCTELKPMVNDTNGVSYFDAKSYLETQNRLIYFDKAKEIRLKFNLTTIHLELSSGLVPDCYRMYVEIIYDNSKHNGQMPVTLTINEEQLDCDKKSSINKKVNEGLIQGFMTAFDVLVMIISVTSAVLCGRSLIKAQRLKKETVEFFKMNFQKDLTVYDTMEFLNLWYVLIILNDCLTFFGSVFKIEIELKIWVTSNYDVCSMLLGSGSLLVWLGVLRYLTFFKKYNILILTMKKSAPNVLRFLVCAGVLYFGFIFCGWVILGPYHIKFRDIMTTSECLFSLVNGDDMFTTFATIQSGKNTYIYIYSRIYLYLFISLFIYVVLSVFISVIMDTYETIKEYYEHGFPKSDIQEFIEECTDSPHSPLYRSDNAAHHTCCLFPCCSCCTPEQNPDEPNEYSSLIQASI